MPGLRLLFPAALVALALSAVAIRKDGDFHPAPPVRAVRLSERTAFVGFMEMVGPIRPPTSEDEEVRIVVYVRLPEHGVIAVRPSLPGAPPALAYPPGTVAERVEYLGRGAIDAPAGKDWRILDVRGTALGDGDVEEFHVYRPASSDDEMLLGVAWPRGDARAQDEATRALGQLVERGLVAGPSGADARDKAASKLRSLNGCAACHVHERPPRVRTSDPGIVSRGSDASGFFAVPTVLSDRAPLETYRPRNANLGDAFVRFACGPDEEPALRDPRAPGGVRCPGGEIPLGILDVRGALAVGDLHARRLCESRRALLARLDPAGRELFAIAARECEFSQTP